MSIPVPALARSAALLALAWAGSAAAQSAPDGRAWTDPPVRATIVTPAAPNATTVETPPVAAQAAAPETRAAASKPRVAASEPRAVASRSRAAASKSRAAASKPLKAAAKSHVATIRRRPVAVVRIQPGPPSVPVRMARPRTPDLRPVRYGFVPPPPSAYDQDPRARRIRQAEAAGYLVVRRTTLAAPDGRLLYGYRPYGADEFDD